MNIFKLRDVAPQIPNLLFRNRIKFHFEKLPFEARNISFKKKFNFFVAGLNQFFLPARPFGRPVVVQVEPSNVCNLGCPLCYSATHNHSRPAALLPFDTFKRFIDEIGDTILLMVFWNWGEPFLNPDAVKMIAYATAKGILVHTSTNGNVIFNDEMADSIVRSKLTSMIFAVDGSTQETYSTYRVNGNLERVKQNIRTVIKAKERNHSQFPMVTVRFVAMQPNEQEMNNVENLARDLGADFFAVKSVAMLSTTGEKVDAQYRPQESSLRGYQYAEGSYIRETKPFECMRPWKRITMDALGELDSCEFDYKNEHSFGNIRDHASILDTWKSNIAAQFRRQFNRGNNQFYHCMDCTYKNMREEDCTLFSHPLHQLKD
jgi:radical SAM protein with 4Fe4S-binding SPASM domain